MKYCINYNATTSHMDCIKAADELTIEYNNKDDTLLEFLELNKDRRINLSINEELELSYLENLGQKYPNLYFKLPLDYLDKIKEKQPDIKYFFNYYVNNWDTFIGLVYKGITDIYIVESLGFELDKIAEIAHKENVSIRVFPNVAQSEWKSINSLKKFFIRPEDVSAYEPYVDVMEFYGEDSKSDIYYKIYAIDKKWFGKLNEIIISFNSDIDSKCMLPRFAEKRIRCGKSCFKGGKCEMCNRIYELSKTFEKSGFIIRMKEDETDGQRGSEQN